MNANIFPFPGRGRPSANHEDSCRLIECDSGTILAVIVYHRRVGFVHTYCRKALMDRWGIYCDAPFRRMSDAACTHSWAEPLKNGLFIFRAVTLEIIAEQEWMRIRR